MRGSRKACFTFDVGADIIDRARATAEWHRQQSERIAAIADRIENFRATGLWLYPHEPGYGVVKAALALRKRQPTP